MTEVSALGGLYSADLRLNLALPNQFIRINCFCALSAQCYERRELYLSGFVCRLGAFQICVLTLQLISACFASLFMLFLCVRQLAVWPTSGILRLRARIYFNATNQTDWTLSFNHLTGYEGDVMLCKEKVLCSWQVAPSQTWSSLCTAPVHVNSPHWQQLQSAIVWYVLFGRCMLSYNDAFVRITSLPKPPMAPNDKESTASNTTLKGPANKGELLSID